MFYDALGLTVLCLPLILVLAVGVPFVILAIQRYQQSQTAKRNKKKPTQNSAKPNRAVTFVKGVVTLSRLFLFTFATLTALAYGVWLLFLAVTGDASPFGS